MTPQEKAKELFKKMYQVRSVSGSDISKYFAKQCAIIAADEILNNNCGSHTDESNAINEEIYCDEYYWQEVKQEIGKL
jgi:hypothetical protein